MQITHNCIIYPLIHLLHVTCTQSSVVLCGTEIIRYIIYSRDLYTLCQDSTYNIFSRTHLQSRSLSLSVSWQNYTNTIWCHSTNGYQVPHLPIYVLFLCLCVFFALSRIIEFSKFNLQNATTGHNSNTWASFRVAAWTVYTLKVKGKILKHRVVVAVAFLS